MPSKDLREYIEKHEKRGSLKRITKEVDWNLELSHIAKLNEEAGGPALLFENVKDYNTPVLTGVWGTTDRFAYEIGREDATMMQLAMEWGDILAQPKISPKVVKTGPVLENIIEEKDVDILKQFPVPKFYPLDGGRYIGTSYALISKDPDTGWVNLGTYRLQVHDKNHTGVQMNPSKHARMHLEKWAARGEKMPVAAVIGGPPIIFPLGGGDIPADVSEYDVGGAILGEAIEVIESDLTGLPIPATAEIVLEGFMDADPESFILEGPFGEATGYYSGLPTKKEAIHVTRILHRNNPILNATTVGRPTTDTHMVGVISRGGAFWRQLKDMKIPGIKGFSIPPEMGNRGIIISLKQSYPGHSKQVLTAAASTPYGAFACKFFCVVDDDIDPEDYGRVAWAASQRFDPQRSVDILKGRRSTWLEPGIEPKKRYPYPIISTLLIDGCTPYEWEEKPTVIRLDEETVKKVKSQWKDYGLK
jgi:phenyl-phosphate phosphatase/carboxylase subunit beta